MSNKHERTEFRIQRRRPPHPVPGANEGRNSKIGHWDTNHTTGVSPDPNGPSVKVLHRIQFKSISASQDRRNVNTNIVLQSPVVDSNVSPFCLVLIWNDVDRVRRISKISRRRVHVISSRGLPLIQIETTTNFAYPPD